jgi:hypothetical protein
MLAESDLEPLHEVFSEVVILIEDADPGIRLDLQQMPSIDRRLLFVIEEDPHGPGIVFRVVEFRRRGGDEVCGIFFAFKYFRIAVLGAVPRLPKMCSTPSCSISLRVCSTVLGGLKPSSRLIKVAFRPLIPPCSLSIRKNAV